MMAGKLSPQPNYHLARINQPDMKEAPADWKFPGLLFTPSRSRVRRGRGNECRTANKLKLFALVPKTANA